MANLDLRGISFRAYHPNEDDDPDDHIGSDTDTQHDGAINLSGIKFRANRLNQIDEE